MSDDISILKSSRGVYLDTPENRRKNRVGRVYDYTQNNPEEDDDDQKDELEKLEDQLQNVRKREEFIKNHRHEFHATGAGAVSYYEKLKECRRDKEELLEKIEKLRNAPVEKEEPEQRIPEEPRRGKFSDTNSDPSTPNFKATFNGNEGLYAIETVGGSIYLSTVMKDVIDSQKSCYLTFRRDGKHPIFVRVEKNDKGRFEFVEAYVKIGRERKPLSLRDQSLIFDGGLSRSGFDSVDINVDSSLKKKILEKHQIMNDDKIEKSRTGRYEDNSKNRRLHRVGQQYGSPNEKNEEGSETTDFDAQISLIERKMETMRKNQRIFFEQEGGRLKYDAAMRILDGKLNDLKEKRKSSLEESWKKNVSKMSDKELQEKIQGLKEGDSKNQDQTDKDLLSFLNREMEGRSQKAAKDGGYKQPKLSEIPDDKLKQVQELVQKEMNTLSTEYWKTPDASRRKDISDQIEIHGKLIDSYQKELDSRSKAGEKGKPSQTVEQQKKVPSESQKETETEESFTRVKFDDVPNSGKVNLKKYLSEKMKHSADEAWGNIEKIDTEGLRKMERGAVEDFNRQFDDLPKSRRAEKLYGIMKIKGELEKRKKR